MFHYLYSPYIYIYFCCYILDYDLFEMMIFGRQDPNQWLACSGQNFAFAAKCGFYFILRQRLYGIELYHCFYLSFPQVMQGHFSAINLIWLCYYYRTLYRQLHGGIINKITKKRKKGNTGPPHQVNNNLRVFLCGNATQS